ncbi:MAG: hypothetical protein LBF97_04910 [Elusimicrobiota bacterium]|jgi:DNA-binding MurR/RpiR family transcriptional regulator|nr:hypothetical protein [Elusimicrobiota bacterium]
MEIKKILEITSQKINKLSKKEREIILSYYFLIPYKTIKELSNKKKQSKQTLYRIKEKILRKID